MLDDDRTTRDPDDSEEGYRNRSRRPRRTARVDPGTASGIERRMAAMMVRSLCNEHDCQAPKTGTCNHSMHRQKVRFALEMLDMLGLDRAYPAYTEAEKKTWLGWLGQSGPPESVDGIGLEDAA